MSLTFFISPKILKPIYSKIGIGFLDQFNFYSTIHRFWQFGAGALCFILFKKENVNRKRTKCVSLLLLLIISFTNNSISNITMTGTYSMKFNITDLALNNLSGVIMDLQITI